MLCDRPDWLREYSPKEARSQAVGWSPDRWRAAFEGSEWLHLIDRIEGRDQFRNSISRGDVLDLSKDCPEEPDSLVEVFLAGMIWGRPENQGPRGQISDFRQALESGGVEKLMRLRKMLREGDIVRAYDSMSPRNTNKLTRLGTTFGTKALYFLGYSICPPGPRPLIWDSRVATSLWMSGCSFWTGTFAWDPLGYEIYLKLCHKWAGELVLAEEDLHVIEFGLFSKALELPNLWERDRKAALDQLHDTESASRD